MIGVVVGRFQVPDLHAGHMDLFEQAKEHYDKLVVFLGVPPQPDTRNPLSFDLRKEMIERHYPAPLILPFRDQPGQDRPWVADLDTLLDKTFGLRSVQMFGGRDSFLSVYALNGGQAGTLKAREHYRNTSGTAIRAALQPRHTEDFRAGVIYAWNSIPSS